MEGTALARHRHVVVLVATLTELPVETFMCLAVAEIPWEGVAIRSEGHPLDLLQ